MFDDGYMPYDDPVLNETFRPWGTEEEDVYVYGQEEPAW